MKGGVFIDAIVRLVIIQFFCINHRKSLTWQCFYPLLFSTRLLLPSRPIGLSYILVWSYLRIWEKLVLTVDVNAFLLREFVCLCVLVKYLWVHLCCTWRLSNIILWMPWLRMVWNRCIVTGLISLARIVFEFLHRRLGLNTPLGMTYRLGLPMQQRAVWLRFNL